MRKEAARGVGRDSMCKGPGVEGKAERLYDRTGCLELGARGLLLRGHLQSGCGDRVDHNKERGLT